MTNTPKKVTRKDVARVAGTSVAVVSYVVNNGPRPVSDELRERVVNAIRETGYRPNAVARALASGETGNIGLIIPNVKNPYLAELAHAVGAAARARDLNILFGDSADDRVQEKRLLESFLLSRIDGLLFYGVDGCPEELKQFEGHTPILVFDAWDTPKFAHSMTTDETAAVSLTVEHLINHVRTKIALINGPLDQRNSQLRLDGWQKALRKNDMEARPELTISAPYTRTGGYDAAVQMLAAGIEFDGVMAANESQAIGFLAAAHESGIAVPKEISVAAFNGTSAGAFTVPSLTAFEKDARANADRALEQLLAAKEPQNLWTAGALVPRASCGCPSSYASRR